MFARREDVDDRYLLLEYLREMYPDQTFETASNGYIWLEREIVCDEGIPLYEFVNLVYNEDLVFVLLNLSRSMLPTTEEILEDEESEDDDEDEPFDRVSMDEARALLESIIPQEYIDVRIEDVDHD